MRTNQLITLAFACSLFVYLGCGKEKTGDDVTPPVISITAPSAASVYNTLDTLFLDAMITDESEISDVTVRILYGGDSLMIWPPTPVIFGNVTQYHLDDFVVDNITVPSPTSATVRIYATDKHDNMGTKDVSITLQ